jgi:uroporphyrinogen decarboxylase
MTHKDRFFATLERRPVDHPASWLGLPDAKAIPGLVQYFKVRDMDGVRKVLDDDVYPVEFPYHAPKGNAIYLALDFAKDGLVDEEHRTLNAPGFFEDMTDPARINDFDWPDPSKHIDTDECRSVVENVMPDRAVLGVIWSSFFQDAWAAFGMANACVQMMLAPDMFRGIVDKCVDFYLQANEIFFEATKGKLDAILIGNDYGAQTGPVISPDSIREFAMEGTRKLIAQAKSYGLKVIHHSCGSIYDIIPDLIDAGVDAIHPIQALATDMSAEKLAADFKDKISFVGGLDAQHLLVSGTPEEIRKRVIELKSLFPTGLVISPSHEAILPDVNPANVEALFKAIK